MLLVGKQKIDVPLTGCIKAVLIPALVAACGAEQDIPADRALQDGVFGSVHTAA
jgi:hypothetical protein